MLNEEVHSILNNVLLALQLCLGIWQFLKLTPVGALLKGVAGWLLRPLGLSPNYARLQCYRGRVFKKVNFEVVCVTEAEDLNVEKIQVGDPVGFQSEERSEWVYLGVKHVLEKREGNKLFVDGKMSYYITDFIWEQLSRHIENGVYIKGCKEFWKGVAIGGLMSAEEVLDYIILENHVTKKFRGEDYLLLPVDWAASEEKLLKILNMAGLFFQAKKVYWPIPLFFSLMSAILEFGTPLRKWLYGNFNLMFCCAVHLIIDQFQFSYPVRSMLYSLGNWVENLKPSNDIKSKVLRGRISAVIAGGAKTDKEEDATLVQQEADIQQEEEDEESGIVKKTFNCGDLQITSSFDRQQGYCGIGWSDKGVNRNEIDDNIEFKVDSTRYINLCTFLSWIKRNESGSLKCSTRNGSRVKVRGLKESLQCYAKNKFPRVYELHFDNAIVN